MLRFLPLFFLTLLPILVSRSVAVSPPTFYDPIERQIEGWLVRVDPRLTEEPNKEIGDRALAMLRWQLEGVKIRIPADRLAELQTIGIWIELESAAVSTMQYHPSVRWLKKQKMDPRLEGFVHIPNAKRLADKAFFHKQPSAVLHELSHGFHDQILGFDYAPVMDAYKAGVAAGSYSKVLHITGRKVEHYSVSNHKEYFAEGCEAYFGRNDYYPFVRTELNKHDPGLYKVLQEIWGK
ncbi:MAG: hypothetical protein ACI8W8_005017 [Rhodothermales bacterium]|jgi:hypothetical protein